LAWPVVLTLVACGDDGDSNTSADSAVTIGPATTPMTMNTGDDDGGDDDDGTATSADDTTQGTSPTGDDSTGGGNAFPVCNYQCTGDGDCTVNGESFALSCVAGECNLACATNDTCIATLSFWAFEPCTGNADCKTGKCVAFDGMGGCGFGPDDAPCADFGLLAFQRMDVQGGNITVCGVPGGTCDSDGTCFIQCDASSCPAGLTCGASGKCECAEDLDCVMAQAGERCLPSGECAYACVSATDCPATDFDGAVANCG
jgi:hypothetical protein